MKTKSLKAILILVGLTLTNISQMNASVTEKFQKFIGNEFSSFQGLYIMAGVTISFLLVYILTNHFGKKENEKSNTGAVNYPINRRHHQRSVIKKTS